MKLLHALPRANQTVKVTAKWREATTASVTPKPEGARQGVMSALVSPLRIAAKSITTSAVVARPMTVSVDVDA